MKFLNDDDGKGQDLGSIFIHKEDQITESALIQQYLDFLENNGRLWTGFADVTLAPRRNNLHDCWSKDINDFACVVSSNKDDDNSSNE